MSTRALRYLVSTLLLIVAFGAQPAAAKRFDGVVTAVKNPEVLAVEVGASTYDVRIYGIDAPEDGQPFAAEAKVFVRERLLGKNVGARFKYRNAAGERVSRVFLDESDVAIEMLRLGLAWRLPGASYKPSDDQHADEMTGAELEARSARRGLWSQANPAAPWAYRGEAPEAEATPSGIAHGVAGTVDLNTSKKTGDDNECAIAKNPANAQQLFIFCNTTGAGMFAARSIDGGVSWIYPDPSDKTIVDGDPGQGIAACCDPSLAWDSFGNLFVSYLGNSPLSVDTLLSTDGGATFTQLPTISASGNDQQTVVTADITGGNHVVWVVFNQSDTMKAVGAAVTGLGAVGPWSAVQTAANPGGGDSCSFGDIAIAPSGAVVQVCEFPNSNEGPANLLVNIDPDGIGGAGFGPAITATSTNVGGFDFIPAQDSRSVDSEAGLAYDRNPASPHFGRLYMVYTEETVNENSNLEVLVRTSDDNGATWSGPVTVNTDGTTRSQFMPKIATDPVTGNVVICWHDARGSASNSVMEMYCDSATASTFPAFLGNTLVSDGSSTSNGVGVEFGDYMGLAVGSSTAHPVWSDTSNSTGDNPNGTSNFDVYSDRYSMLAADYTLAATPTTQSVCAPADATFTVNVGAFGGYIDPVNLSASGHPAGTTTNFTVNPVTPAGSSVLTIGNTSGGTPGAATILVSAASTTGQKAVQLTLNLSTGMPAAATLTTPANAATGVITQPNLVWAEVPSATSYFLEVSDDATFTTVDYSATVSSTSHQLTSSLAPSTEYFWRVTATNGCGSTASGAFSFTTANVLTVCGGPVTINDNAVAAPYPSVANVAAATGGILGLELAINGLTHTFPDDVDMLLVSPSGQKLIFMSDAGGDGNVSGLNLTLADGAATLLSDGGPLVAGTFGPSNVTATDTFAAPAPAGPYNSPAPAGAATFLSSFGASAVNGAWNLYVVDDAGTDVGSIAQWCLNITLGGDMPFVDGFESGGTSAWSATVP